MIDAQPVMNALNQDCGLMMRALNQDRSAHARKTLVRSPDVNSDTYCQLASVFGAEMRMATSPDEEIDLKTSANCKVKVEQIETADGIQMLSHATAYATL